jgi:hypothetical protein
MIYRFGDYELDTQLFELRCGGTPLQIEPKVFDLLTQPSSSGLAIASSPSRSS